MSIDFIIIFLPLILMVSLLQFIRWLIITPLIAIINLLNLFVKGLMIVATFVTKYIILMPFIMLIKVLKTIADTVDNVIDKIIQLLVKVKESNSD